MATHYRLKGVLTTRPIMARGGVEAAMLFGDDDVMEARRAVETLFKVTVVKVNVMNYAGKRRRERQAGYGKQSDWKRAIVTLKPGDKIALAVTRGTKSLTINVTLGTAPHWKNGGRPRL